MNNLITPLILFILSLVVLFFLSRMTINQIFHSFYQKTKKRRLTSILLSILYLPGTCVHELCHFVAAIALLLKVTSITVIPEFKNDRIILGSVVYEKKDIFRSILVGIAPIIGGTILLYVLFSYHLFPTSSILMNILVGYFIFTLSSSMFSSREDIKDLIYTVPFIIIGFLFWFFLKPSIHFAFVSPSVQTYLSSLLIHASMYLGISIGINGALLLVFKFI